MAWAIPAAMGGVGLLSSLFGNQNKLKKFPTMAPYQQQAFQGAVQNPIQNQPGYQAGNSYLQNLLSNNPEAFKAFEAPFMQNFNQNIAPGIAERFAGMGTGGSLSSSGLNNSLAQAGRNLQTDLAGLKGQLQMQALPQALSYAQQPFSNVFAQSQIPTFAYGREQPGFFESAGAGLFGGLGQGLGLAGGAQGFGPLSQYFQGLLGQGIGGQRNFGINPISNAGFLATNNAIPRATIG